jgi:peptidoglycan/LPS O-acetylase OafA/YrhL
MELLIRLFRRETTSKEFIPVIDGLRFLAILMVVLFHADAYIKERAATLQYSTEGLWFAKIPDVFYFMDQGVQLFFVISGFILAIPFMRFELGLSDRKPKLRSYYLRRITRLEPPYIISTILIFLLLLFVFNSKYPPGTLITSLFSSLFYVHTLVFPGEFPYINSVTWSLEIEVQYYILAPFFIWFLCQVKDKWKRRAVNFLLIVLFSCLSWVIEEYFQSKTMTLLLFLQYFFTGILLCDVFLLDSDKLERLDRWWVFVLGLILLVPITCTELSFTPSLILRILFPPMLLAFYLIVFGNKWWNKIFSLSGITLIGGMCYSIYLLHTVIISAVGRLTVVRLQGYSYLTFYWSQVMIFLVAVLAVSAIYFLLIEKPCMKRDWHTKLWQRIRSYALFGNKVGVKDSI